MLDNQLDGDPGTVAYDPGIDNSHYKISVYGWEEPDKPVDESEAIVSQNTEDSNQPSAISSRIKILGNGYVMETIELFKKLKINAEVVTD